ncbi:MAG TPA: phosphatidylglycerol lysyltransferase domain-containing protein [Candidatus Saccharimonadales bacterium]|nr:phosphatidylglycerol lysyltransferase domain-containing protein [Candidatus Saccharimonadales bacterium]
MKRFLFVSTIALTFISGILTILATFEVHRFHGPLFNPLFSTSVGRFATLLLGLGQMYLAFNLSQSKRIAWWLAMLVAGLSAAAHVLQHNNLVATILPLFLLASLLLSREQFVVRAEPTQILSGVRRAVSVIWLAIAIGTFAFWEESPIHFGANFDLWPALQHSISVVILGRDDLVPITRHAHQFLSTLHWLGIFSYVLVIYSLFRPVYDRFVLTPSNMREVERLARLYAHSSEDIFKLWPADKSYFFTEDHEGFIAYKVTRGCAVALADPIASRHLQLVFARRFAEYASQHGWTPAFLHAPASSHNLYESAGYALLKIGENAVVDVRTFVDQTARNKHFRNVANRFTKQGYKVEYYNSPHNAPLLHELRMVSDSWLELPGRSERSFGLGFFDEDYLQMSKVAVLRDPAGKIVAFVNQQPNYSKRRASIDLMRHLGEAPPNVMDFLLQQMIIQAHTEGWQEFDLGLVPLAGVGKESAAPIREKLMAIFYERGDRLFAFQGLYRFKNKFAPQWETSYLAYVGSSALLPKIALALANLFRGR